MGISLVPQTPRTQTSNINTHENYCSTFDANIEQHSRDHHPLTMYHYSGYWGKNRYHHAPKKVLERFEDMEKYAVFYRILPPGSTDPYELGAVPKESCQDGVVTPGYEQMCYPSLVSNMWRSNFPQDTCLHCNATPCPAGAMVNAWFEKIKMSNQRMEYRHPGYQKGEELKSDPTYRTTWFQQKYHDYVLRNYSGSMESQDRVKFRCLCFEEELACRFPERCSACGFKPCLVHQAGKMIYNYLQGAWGSKHDVVKFREMMACFKKEWESRRGLRDGGYAKEDGRAPRPQWMSDDLFSDGHGPSCVDSYARLLFPKAASSRDFRGMYPSNDGLVMAWTRDEGHLYDLEASQVEHADWLLWCEDADPVDWDRNLLNSYSCRMDNAFRSEIFDNSDSEESHFEIKWLRRARRAKNVRNLRRNDRILKRKVREFIDTTTSESDSGESSSESSMEEIVPVRRIRTPPKPHFEKIDLRRPVRAPVSVPVRVPPRRSARVRVPVVAEVPL